MQTLQHETVIVGTGFAGRTVASHLRPGSFVLLERGEDRSHGETINRYRVARAQGLRPVDAEAQAFRSDRPWNRFERLSSFCYSQYAMVRGGASNWWGGKATRLSDAVFDSQEGLAWPLSRQQMASWYAQAERRLGVAGDPLAGPSHDLQAIAGARTWRTAFAPFLQPSALYAVAINTAPGHTAPGPLAAAGQGTCVGRAHCALCPEDAKARPDNRFDPMDTIYDACVQEIEFSGDRAVAVVVFDGRQLFRVECERVVVAANGVETPRLLARSALPDGVNRAALGRFCQDHAHLEIDCWIPKPLPFGSAGTLSHVLVKELSGLHHSPLGSIETSALALTHGPGDEALHRALRPEWIADSGLRGVRAGLQGAFRIFVELETPMQIDARVDLSSDVARIHDARYAELVPIFDRITQAMCTRLQERGVTVLRTLPHYRHGYGGHHFVGTTNWSRGPHNMMESDGRLGGTRNVFVAGASVVPRAGGVAPTLTLVALAERLGSLLADGLPATSR